MVDEQDGSPLTPEQESAVRRLVAEARHDEPVPVTVAARLDRVLDHLATEATSSEAPVVDLATRRRRRTVGRLLVAAAAVVVGGVAIGQLVGGLGQGSGGSQSPAAQTADRETGEAGGDDGTLKGGDEDAPDLTDGMAPEANSAESGSAQLQRQLRDFVPVDLHAATLDRDVRRVYRQGKLAKRSAVAVDSGSAYDYWLDSSESFDCPPAAYGIGLLLPAYFDGQPAVLAFRPPVGSRRLAQLLECGTAEALGGLTLTYNRGN